MRITNTTDNSKNSGVKVIGIGDYSIMPGETKEVPDRLVYVDETDANGKLTGRKTVLPSIMALARKKMITYVETAQKAEVPAPPVIEQEKPVEKPAEKAETEEKPVMTDEEKKAAAAAKRAATRAKNKAAKAAAAAAAAEKGE